MAHARSLYLCSTCVHFRFTRDTLLCLGTAYSLMGLISISSKLVSKSFFRVSLAQPACTAVSLSLSIFVSAWPDSLVFYVHVLRQAGHRCCPAMTFILTLQSFLADSRVIFLNDRFTGLWCFFSGSQHFFWSTSYVTRRVCS